jgi:hypothetical protein
MKKTFIIFLLIIFSSSFSLADNKLKVSEEDTLKSQIFDCWSIPLGLPFNDDLKVRIKLKLKPDGSVSKIEILDHERINVPGQAFYKVLVESVLKAIKLCQPLRVPTTGYERWKDLVLHFDAREALDMPALPGTKIEKKETNQKIVKKPKKRTNENIEIKIIKLNEKITVEEIENIFFGDKKKYPEINIKKKRSEKTRIYFEKRKKNKGWFDKRQKYRGIAKCKYSDGAWGGMDQAKQCDAKIVRAVFTTSKKNQKKRPGDLFYALSSVQSLIRHKWYDKSFKKSFKFNEGDKPIPGMVCVGEFSIKVYQKKPIRCSVLKKRYYKRIEKFKKDPSNEKILGKSLNEYIKDRRMVNNLKEKIGKVNYTLLGDMLNLTTGDVKKNNINPDLQKRRALLEKYLLIMNNIKKKLDEDKYKSIDKDVSRLLKTYGTLKTLPTTANQIANNVDETIKIIFDTNKLVQSSALSAKDNEEQKLLAQSSIFFMKSLINSILNTIPEKYYAETKELPQDLFSEFDLEELERSIDIITIRNKDKSAKFIKSLDIINNYIKTSEVLKKLNNLGIKNDLNKPLTHNKVTKIITQAIRDNLDTEVLKDVRKIFQEIDRNELADITKEVSDIASEVASSSSVKEATSSRAVDREYGGQNLKKLIGAARR